MGWVAIPLAVLGLAALSGGGGSQEYVECVDYSYGAGYNQPAAYAPAPAYGYAGSQHNNSGYYGQSYGGQYGSGNAGQYGGGYGNAGYGGGQYGQAGYDASAQYGSTGASVGVDASGESVGVNASMQ